MHHPPKLPGESDVIFTQSGEETSELDQINPRSHLYEAMPPYPHLLILLHSKVPVPLPSQQVCKWDPVEYHCFEQCADMPLSPLHRFCQICGACTFLAKWLEGYHLGKGSHNTIPWGQTFVWTLRADSLHASCNPHSCPKSAMPSARPTAVVPVPQSTTIRKMPSFPKQLGCDK